MFEISVSRRAKKMTAHDDNSLSVCLSKLGRSANALPNDDVSDGRKTRRSDSQRARQGLFEQTSEEGRGGRGERRG
jgi:hypothetical protein